MHEIGLFVCFAVVAVTAHVLEKRAPRKIPRRHRRTIYVATGFLFHPATVKTLEGYATHILIYSGKFFN
jgi:hypothetical protein